ncbi:MAG TPA: PAS domain S-box protein [Spirochaetota bacterium]|nr:PAS domain S-box protein [Spirochaetota bacterium]HPI89514.1 PAS domain S-box protein [Spirochaetota bacterium]HPR47102.1 PAS domain S-box protein [Spirochaetota bacterium]
MHKPLEKFVKMYFGSVEKIPESIRDFVESVDREFETLDRRISATEKASDENLLDLIISNVELSSYLSVSSDLIFRINSEDIIVDYVANQDYLGLNLDQFKNKGVRSLPLCDDGDFFSNALSQVRDLKLNLTIEYPVIINSEEYFFNARFLPILENDIVMVIRDITAEKKAMRNLVKSEKRYRELLELIPYPVVVHMDQVLVYVNDAAVNILGAESGESLIGKSVLNFVHPDSMASVSRMLTAHKRGKIKQVSSSEIFFDLHGHEFYVDIISSLISWEDKKAVLVIGRDITDEVKMQKRLYHAEEMYRLLTERISDTIWMLDDDFRLVYMSPAIKRITGFEPADYFGRNAKEMLAPESFNKMFSEIKKLAGIPFNEKIDELKNASILIDMIKKDGTTVPVEIYLSKTIFEDNRPVIIGVSRDISERRKMEEKLRETEQLRDLLLATVTDIIFILDLNGFFTYVGPRFRDVTGHGEDELVGRPFCSFLDESEKADVIAKFESGIKENKTWLYDVTVVFENGDRIPFELNVNTVHDSAGIPIGRIGVGRDIRNKIETTRALAESERLYRMLAENIIDAIWTTDLDLNITYVSPSIIKIKGFTPEEMVSMPPDRIFTPDSLRHAYSVFKEELQKEEEGGWDPQRIWTVEAQEYCKDGRIITTEINAKFLRDDNGRIVGVLGLTRDISRRKKKAAALERDLQVARMIQKAFIPETLPQFGGIKADCRHIPMDDVGGDYFSFNPIHPDTPGVFIGEVSGEGVVAALYLSLIKTMVDRLFVDFPREPKKFIEKLNINLLGKMQLSYLTAIYGFFTRKQDDTVTFTFTSSGHPPPIVFRKVGSSVSVEYCRGSLMGVFDAIQVEEREISLAEGDRLFLYSDGIPKTINPGGEQFGYDRLPELFRASMRPSLGASLDVLIKELNKFRGNMPFGDDIVVIAFEVQSG